MSMEPPDVGLAFYIAAGGEKNVPFLLQKLKTEKRENVQVQILILFDFLAGQGHLKSRQDIFDQLHAIVSAMKIAPFKKQGEEQLIRIKKNL